jgi:hypothetical protein
VDQSPLVARRLGFASLPLAVLAVLIGFQSLSLLFTLHSDSASWAVPSKFEETVHLMKWGVMLLAFWLWYVHRYVTFMRHRNNLGCHCHLQFCGY